MRSCKYFKEPSQSLQQFTSHTNFFLRLPYSHDRNADVDGGNSKLRLQKQPQLRWRSREPSGGLRWSRRTLSRTNSPYHFYLSPMKDDRSSLVYVTGVGRIPEEKTVAVRPATDGIVRISLKRMGGGKMVSAVAGVPLESDALDTLCRVLKQKCGVGGAVKDWVIEIQGDKRAVIKAELEKKGYTVKLAGG